MTEENKFIKIDSLSLYDDGIGAVSIYDSSHSNESEEQRIWAVSTLASIAYGNEEAKNPEALYERLKTLKHESLWEFIRTGSAFNGNTIDESMRCQQFDYADHKEAQGYFVSKEYKQNISCFRIKVPIFVARQFMRHRSFSYIEMSRRYTKGAKVPFEFYVPKCEFETKCMIDAFHDNSINMYNDMISIGKMETQVASRFLPQTTYTEFYMMGEVYGLKNFFQLRLDSHAQTEIRECAEAMISLLAKHQPELYEKVNI
jgi:thymidylate synthase (FAD)